MVLSGHITTLYTKLVHLDKQIQIHCIYPHSQSDAIQLNAPDYDPDIDGEPDSVNAIQPSNANSVKEDTFTGTSKREDHHNRKPRLRNFQQKRQRLKLAALHTKTNNDQLL